MAVEPWLCVLCFWRFGTYPNALQASNQMHTCFNAEPGALVQLPLSRVLTREQIAGQFLLIGSECAMSRYVWRFVYAVEQ